MSDDQESRAGMCNAFGCPLPGSFGADGRWWCICHCHCNPAQTQGITAMLRRHKTLVGAVLQARRESLDESVIAEAENKLLELIPSVKATVEKKGATVPIPTTPAAYHPYADDLPGEPTGD